MSWQEYVDNHLMVDLPHGEKLHSSAILGQDGGVWAQSEAFPPVTPEQIQKITDAILQPDTKLGQLATEGFFLGDIRFRVIQGDADLQILRGKTEKGGCCIQGTASALVVGIWYEPVVASDCNTIVEQMGEYLKESGY